jgi:hypothetical protein
MKGKSGGYRRSIEQEATEETERKFPLFPLLPPVQNIPINIFFPVLPACPGDLSSAIRNSVLLRFDHFAWQGETATALVWKFSKK